MNVGRCLLALAIWCGAANAASANSYSELAPEHVFIRVAGTETFATCAGDERVMRAEWLTRQPDGTLDWSAPLPSGMTLRLALDCYAAPDLAGVSTWIVGEWGETVLVCPADMPYGSNGGLQIYSLDPETRYEYVAQDDL